MTREQILEILENYKLRIPPTVFYDLKADIVNFEEPTTKNDLGGSSGLEKNSKKLEKNFGELDCISRKAILDELEKWDWQELYLPIHFKQMLDELPSVTPQEPRWIPVSERLPDNSGNYLVSVIDGSGEDDDYEAVDVAWFAHKKDYNIKESKWQELGVDKTIIAWMSLPEPYKIESEDKE